MNEQGTQPSFYADATSDNSCMRVTLVSSVETMHFVLAVLEWSGFFYELCRRVVYSRSAQMTVRTTVGSSAQSIAGAVLNRLLFPKRASYKRQKKDQNNILKERFCFKRLSYVKFRFWDLVSLVASNGTDWTQQHVRVPTLIRAARTALWCWARKMPAHVARGTRPKMTQVAAQSSYDTWRCFLQPVPPIDTHASQILNWK